MGIVATGLLTEVLLRDPYVNKRTGETVQPREACMAIGRKIDTFDISNKLNGEVDALVGQHVEADLLYVVNWREVAGKNIPERKCVLVGIRPAPKAAAAQQPESAKPGAQKAA